MTSKGCHATSVSALNWVMGELMVHPSPLGALRPDLDMKQRVPLLLAVSCTIGVRTKGEIFKGRAC